MASAATNYNKTLIQIQKLANSSAKDIQKLVNESNKTQMAFNSAEAQKSRDWQEQMSKSAHQMEVEDLRKAGLNPVLSTGGSGAQSYTTSSASTDNDSGSSAIASMLSQELGAMSNMESARMSADAQLKASAQQAKANRYAAQQSAAAQKYAADQSYKLGVYRAQMDYKARSESNEVEKWKVLNQNATTWAAFLDKYLRNTGISSHGAKLIQQALGFRNKYRDNAAMTYQDPVSHKEKFQFFSNKPNLKAKTTGSSFLGLTKDNFKLNSDGLSYFKAVCKKLGYVPSKTNAKTFVKASVFHDPSAAKQLIRITPVKTRQHVRR